MLKFNQRQMNVNEKIDSDLFNSHFEHKRFSQHMIKRSHIR